MTSTARAAGAGTHILEDAFIGTMDEKDGVQSRVNRFLMRAIETPVQYALRQSVFMPYSWFAVNRLFPNTKQLHVLATDCLPFGCWQQSLFHNNNVSESSVFECSLNANAPTGRGFTFRVGIVSRSERLGRVA